MTGMVGSSVWPPDPAGRGSAGTQRRASHPLAAAAAPAHVHGRWGILLFWVVCAIFGTSIAPHNPLAQQLLATNAAPSAAHWFGTDQLGRDVLSRVIVGARSILLIASPPPCSARCSAPRSAWSWAISAGSSTS